MGGGFLLAAFTGVSVYWLIAGAARRGPYPADAALPREGGEAAVIFLRLFLVFLKIGAFTFGGG